MQAKPGRRGRRNLHPSRDRYIVYVLWLHGHTEGICAAAANLRRKQVSGIVARSPYCNRSAMTLDQRQRELDDLLEVRFDKDGKSIDGGVLRAGHFKVLPLEKDQVRDRVR